MRESCKEIADMLVDYADGQLSGERSSRVAEHLAECSDCRELLRGLRESLELAQVIWQDSLHQAERIRIGRPAKVARHRWLQYAAAAAVILVISATSIIWRTVHRAAPKQPTFAEIERKITEAGNAAKLLAAADLLGGYSGAETIARQQYRRIVETYPDTSAASKAKLQIE
jgi:predicted anti-sigma-YlaC factor YlaD